MFRLLFPPRKPRGARPIRRFRPTLEGLEARFCPTGGGWPPTEFPTGVTVLAHQVDGPTQTVELIGSVQGTGTGHRVVEFSGPVAPGTQAVTDAFGNFSLLAQAVSADPIVVTVSYGGATASTSVLVANMAPTIGQFMAVAGPGNLWTFQGTVLDELPQGLTVTFGGSPVSLQGQTAVVGPDGTFSLTVQLNDQLSDNGVVTAQVLQDWWGLASAPATSFVTQHHPSGVQVNAVVVDGATRTVLLSGVVFGESAGNRLVTFAGAVAPGAETMTDAFGNFALVTQATSAGQITASVTYGGVTESSTVLLSNSAPTITEFTALAGPGNVWTFQGRVLDEHAAGLTVTFGGEPMSLQGQTALVGADGWFTLNLQLNGSPTDDGLVSARVFEDWWGLGSDPAWVAVLQQPPLPPPPPPAPPPPPPASPPDPPPPPMMGMPTGLTLMVAYGPGRTITISGQVLGAEVGNRVVELSGVVPNGTQATTDGTGHFSVTVEVPRLGNIVGTVSYNGTTVTEQITMTNNAPTITDFVAIAGPANIWTFQGRVTDESHHNLTVMFGGEPDSIQGHTATVEEDGWFYLTLELDGTQNDNGEVHASVTDWWGRISNFVSTRVFQAGV
jgi:hypothetical protein